VVFFVGEAIRLVSVLSVRGSCVCLGLGSWSCVTVLCLFSRRVGEQLSCGFVS